MVISGLDHVGYATDDAEGLATLFADLFDVPIAHRERFEGLQVLFLDVGDPCIELLEPHTEDGAIARYIDDRGPGLHHVAFATPDIETALERARSYGVEPIDDAPRAGAWGHEVAFLHPGDTGGMLIEFVASPQ